MNITKKIIITDTNIVTDLNNADVLKEFVNIDNVFISDMVKNDEMNNYTGNLNLINKFKTISSTSNQVREMIDISQKTKGLSAQDIINFIIARDNNGILATGDKRLKQYAEENGIEVIRTLKILKLMINNNIITKEKALKACELLKNDNSTRIPEEEINRIINTL